MATTQPITDSYVSSTTSQQPSSQIFRLAYIYAPGMAGVYQGTLLDTDQLVRLAKWLCTRDCRAWHSEEIQARRRKEVEQHGYCKACLDAAGHLLSECPYIDMERPDQLVSTGSDVMSWQPRSASAPESEAGPIELHKEMKGRNQGTGYDWEMLKRLMGDIENKPKYMFGTKVLDRSPERIAMYPFGDSNYLPSIFKSLGWWNEVVKTLIPGRTVPYTNRKTYCDEAYVPQRDESLRLFSEVLAAIPPAIAQTMHYTETDTPEAALELLKKYRTYARHISAWAQEVWPDVDLKALWDAV